MDQTLEISKIDDEDDVNPPPFSLLYFDLRTYSGILASDDAIRVIKISLDIFNNSNLCASGSLYLYDVLSIPNERSLSQDAICSKSILAS